MSSLSNTFWIACVSIFFIYFLGCQVFFLLNGVILNLESSHFASCLFHSPDIIIFVVTATSCFFISNLGYRFLTLNRLWKRLPPGIIALPGGWASSELTILVECIRLLHAELSELLRLFSLGYGSVLLIYFTFTFIQALIEIYIIIALNKNLSGKLGFVPLFFYIQYFAFTMSILCITSWIIKKV